MPVVDASVLVGFLSSPPGADRLRVRLLREDEELWAPHVVEAEVGHALRRGVRRGDLSPRQGDAALEELVALPLERAAHAPLLQRAWQLRDNVSFYDALYVALAEGLGMPLLTLDARLVRAPGSGVDIELLDL